VTEARRLGMTAPAGARPPTAAGRPVRDRPCAQAAVRQGRAGRFRRSAAFRKRLDALPPAARAELLHVLCLPDLDWADRIGEFWGHPKTRGFGELLIDLEEDKAARAVVFGLLAEMERK
jgi:hypothetical protein